MSQSVIQLLQAKAKLTRSSPHAPVLLLGAVAGAITAAVAICTFVAMNKLDELFKHAETKSRRDGQAAYFFLGLAACVAMALGVLLAGFLRSRYLVYAGVGLTSVALPGLLGLALNYHNAREHAYFSKDEQAALRDTAAFESFGIALLTLFSLAIIHPLSRPSSLSSKVAAGVTAVSSLMFWVGAIVMLYELNENFVASSAFFTTSTSVFGIGLISWIATVLSNAMPCDSLATVTAAASAMTINNAATIFAQLSQDKTGSTKDSEFAFGTSVIFLSMLLNLGVATTSALRAQDNTGSHGQSVLEVAQTQKNGKLVAAVLVLLAVAGAAAVSICAIVGESKGDYVAKYMRGVPEETITLAYTMAALSCWVMVIGLVISALTRVNTIVYAGVALAASALGTQMGLARVFSYFSDLLITDYEDMWTLRDTAIFQCIGLCCLTVMCLVFVLPLPSFIANRTRDSCNTDTAGQVLVMFMISLFFWIFAILVLYQSSNYYSKAAGNIAAGLLLLGVALLMWVCTVFSVAMPSDGIVTLATLLSCYVMATASQLLASLRSLDDLKNRNFEFKMAYGVLIFTCVLVLIPAVEYGRKAGKAMLSSLTESLV